MSTAIDDTELAATAQREAALTHFHPIAGDVSAFVVVLCRQLVRGTIWSDAIAVAGKGRQAPTRGAIEVRSPDALRRGGFSPDVLAAAKHFVETANSFDEALAAALHFAGPANYCPVLAGSIGGARWGDEQVEPRHLQHCGILGRVRDAAERLSDEW